jgi:outer membrane protein OmpA-like peptidoglycan-associated protein
MKHPARIGRLLPGVWLLALAALAPAPAVFAQETPPTVIDSNTIVRSLKPPSHTATRGLEIEAKTSTEAAGGSGSGKINLDIRFGNDSNKLTEATQTQLAALGHALSSPDLANARFLIAGHTSATGSAEHNQKLSEMRARSVRSYLIEHFHIAPARIEATGYGSSRPLPDFAPAALQQRRVEIITLPNT